MKSRDPETMSPQRILVVGYGNDLRGDDGLGPAVAARVEEEAWPGVRVVRCHQLTPELAASMATVDRVVFVDAEQNDGGGVQVRELGVARESAAITHVCEPEELLELTRLAYDRRPRAWWVTVPGVCFGLGASLSAETRPGIESAVRAIRELCLGGEAAAGGTPI